MDESTSVPPEPRHRAMKVVTPLVIVLLGLAIAGIILLEGRAVTGSTGAVSRGEDAHLRGIADAPVRMIEFSDFECPFCARLHPTLERIQEENPDRVAWEYRHLPLPNHRNAEGAARAGECIARLAGNDAFWSYADAAFANQRGLGPTFYETFAGQYGIDSETFAACMADPAIAERVAIDYQDAIKNGGNGTPFVIIRYEDGSTKSFTGALPYEQVRNLVLP